MKSSIFRSFWIYGCAAGIFLAIFSAYPQLKLWNADSPDPQGHYAYNDIDEVAYASYLKALIDGRPRKNDPYTGRDDSVESPQPESLFSIQFAAPYLVALPSRLFGISAPTAMTLAGIISGFLAALFCFVLIREISGNALLGFAGSLFVLCGGALFAGEGAIGEITGTGFSYPYFPFLRRYVPAVPFPAFFLMLLAVWKMLEAEKKDRIAGWGALALVCFSFLVFSYFYIWTTAAAWLFCLAGAVLIVRPENWKRRITSLVSLGTACAGPLLFYVYLLSQRGETMDNVQLLVKTRELDLDRVPLMLGVAALFAAGVLVLTKLVNARSTAFIFAVVTGLVPIVLFNQQVITGMSLQPIHYQVFIGNYVAGLSLVLVFGAVISKRGGHGHWVEQAVLAVVAILSIVWGFVECHYTVRVLDQANLARDRAYSVGKLLTEEARSSKDPYRDTILSFSNIHADDSPTVAPQAVLWARHQHVFAGLTWQESKERFYKQLYYRDLGPEWLDGQLKSGNFVAMIALFGWGRHTDRLSADARPLTVQEITVEVAKYREFFENFDRSKSLEPELDYLVIPADNDPALVNLGNWYRKSLLKETGGYKIYALDPIEQ